MLGPEPHPHPHPNPNPNPDPDPDPNPDPDPDPDPNPDPDPGPDPDPNPSLRKAIVLGDAPPSELFREAQQAVVVSMKLDIFPRFIESKLYEELVGLKFEDRKVANMGA